MTGDLFDTRSLDDLHAMVATAEPSRLARAGQALSDTAEHIQEVAGLLRHHLPRAHWAGWAGDAFRQRGGILVRETLALADSTRVVAEEMMRAAQALAEAKAAVPVPAGRCFADAVAEAARAEAENGPKHQEAVRQLNRLSSCYHVVGERITAQTEPRLDNLGGADHTGAFPHSGRPEPGGAEGPVAGGPGRVAAPAFTEPFGTVLGAGRAERSTDGHAPPSPGDAVMSLASWSPAALSPVPSSPVPYPVQGVPGSGQGVPPSVAPTGAGGAVLWSPAVLPWRIPAGLGGPATPAFGSGDGAHPPHPAAGRSTAGSFRAGAGGTAGTARAAGAGAAVSTGSGPAPVRQVGAGRTGTVGGVPAPGRGGMPFPSPRQSSDGGPLVPPNDRQADASGAIAGPMPGSGILGVPMSAVGRASAPPTTGTGARWSGSARISTGAPESARPGGRAAFTPGGTGLLGPRPAGPGNAERVEPALHPSALSEPALPEQDSPTPGRTEAARRAAIDRP